MKNRYLLLAAGVVAISFAAVLIRLADSPPLVIAFYRMGIASALLAPFAVRSLPAGLSRLSAGEIGLIGLSSLFLAAHFGLWITSLSYTSISASVVLVTSHPVFVAVASYYLFGEKINRQMAFGMVTVIAGVVVINLGFSFSSSNLLGNMLALGAAIAMGGYLLTGRKLRARIDTLTYIFLVYGVSALILLASVSGMGLNLTGYNLGTYSMMVLLALVPQLVGHSCINLCVRQMPATVVSVAILGEPVGATLLGWLILGQAPVFKEIIGGIIILAGILFVVRQNYSLGYSYDVGTTD